MSLYSQPLLDVHGELTIDLFAGGGGASSGFEEATGRPIDIAINHDPAAIELHKANHPQTLHLRSDVFEVNPRHVTEGRPVGFLWASPDCTFHSKARGGKPIRHKNKKRRALAWVVTRWAGQVRPRVIMLENVEEFAHWGPLRARRTTAVRGIVRANGTEWDSAAKHVELTDGSLAERGSVVSIEDQQLVPDPRKRGRSFARWVKSLTDMGYVVEWRELRACDYGAPTIRKRLFLIARCDGKPIVWPEPTHGAPESAGVKARKLKPYRTAAECIDWSIPMLSIFATPEEAKAWGIEHGQSAPKRPLVANTERRIARGVRRYVLDNAKPYLVTIAHSDTGPNSKRWGDGVADLDRPLATVMSKNQFAVAAPVMVKNNHGDKPFSSPEEPLPTIVAGGTHHMVAAPFLATNRNAEKPTNGADEPTHTITAGGAGLTVVSPFLAPRYGEREGQEPRSRSIEAPMPTVVNDANGGSLVAAHVTKFRNGATGQDLDRPLDTITANSGETGRPGGAAPLGIAAAHLSTYYGGENGDMRGVDLNEPIRTQGTENRFALTTASLAQNNEGFYKGAGRSLTDPAPTICTEGSTQSLIGVSLIKQRGTSTDADPQEPLDTISAGGLHHGIAAAHIQRDFGESVGSPADAPIGTVTGGGQGKSAVVASFLTKYYCERVGQTVGEPIHTVPTVDRFGCVSVTLSGEEYVIVDIAMRMLQPRELYLAQGFRPGYVIDRGADGRALTKTEQVRMVGNSVSPPCARALVAANCPDLVARRDLRKGKMAVAA